ncbi:MAG: type II toxin-antitoxin system RelE/ParE family toxin [Deltaproteobacteria bacterium]|nr:type II toxin-antitoxin system RelE/ParE family toxin [Deltaproteobacteria bacterium]
MDVLKYRDFARWARRHKISDVDLAEVIHEMSRGLLGDRLGGYVYKKRVRLQGQGKRGGSRAIVVFKKDDVAVFLYGYAKNEKSDLTPEEEKALRIFGAELANLSLPNRSNSIREGNFIRVPFDP